METKAANNSANGVVAFSTAGHSAVATVIDRLEAVNNNGLGIQGNGPAVGILIGNSTVTGNGTGVSVVNGAAIGSYKNNIINANGIDGTPLTAVPVN
jgi:hypothetical protein